MTLTLVCACGKRLKAAGATPGRVGKCPACGGLLRVPDAEPTEKPTPSPDLRVERGVVAPDDEPSADGYGLAPTTSVGPPTFVESRREGPRPEAVDRPRAAPVGRGGFVKFPAQVEARIRDSFLYPLWDTAGLFCFLFMPLILAPMSAATLGVLQLVVGGNLFALMVGGLLALCCAFMIGYVSLFLNQIAVAGAMGDSCHPRWPDIEAFAILGSLFRWLWAAAGGIAISGVLATVYWVYCGDIDWYDRVVLAAIFTLGAAYSQLALVASLLFDDIVAANPFTVFRALGALGASYIQPSLLTGLFIGLAVEILPRILAASNPFLILFGLFVFWMGMLYGAMVVLRVLGLYYYRNSAVLGWFPDRPRWGA